MVNYRLETVTHDLGYESDLKSARWRAFGYILEHPHIEKYDVHIINDATGDHVGAVYYDKSKDRYGKERGPVYWSAKNLKKYLLDYDGSIFDYNTGNRIRTVKRKPRTNGFGL